CVLAITARSLRIVEDSGTDLHGHFLTVDEGLQAFADAIKSALHQCQPEGTTQGWRMIGGRYPAFLWYRTSCDITRGVDRNQRLPFLPPEGRIIRQDRHQLFAVLSHIVGAQERALADKVFVLSDDPVHPHVLWGDCAVSFLADHNEALFRSEERRVGKEWRSRSERARTRNKYTTT